MYVTTSNIKCDLIDCNIGSIDGNYWTGYDSINDSYQIKNKEMHM